MRSDGRMGEGVALFIKNCIGFKINEAYNLTTAEAVFVDILGYNNKKTLIGAIYRPLAECFQNLTWSSLNY